MKKAFAECYRAVLACEDESGRKRCELFRDLPDKRVSLIDFFSMSNLNFFFFVFVPKGLPRLLPIDCATNRFVPPAETRQQQLLQDCTAISKRLELDV